VLLKCANVAIDFTTANVGGAKTGTVIHGVLFGEVFFTLSANQFGPDTVEYGKLFVGNQSLTGQALSISLWFLNGGKQMTALDYPSIIPTGTGETYPKYITWDGYVSGVFQQSKMLFNMNLLDQVFAIEQFTTLTRATLRNQADDAIVPADFDIQVWANGVQKGIIPQGGSCCNFDISMGIGATVNDSQTISLASVAPSGVTFSNENAYDGADIVIPGLMPGDGWPLWLKWDLPDGCAGSRVVEIWIGLNADDGE
jgi:hypothetical protein